MRKREEEERGNGWNYNSMLEKTNTFFSKFKFGNKKWSTLYLLYCLSIIFFAYFKDGHINDATLLVLPSLVLKPLFRLSLLHRFAIVREMGIALREEWLRGHLKGEGGWELKMMTKVVGDFWVEEAGSLLDLEIWS